MSGKATRANALPKGWQEVALVDICDPIVSPVDKKTVKGELPVKLCNYTDVYYKNTIDSRIDFMNATAKPQEVEKFSVFAGDVIITKDSETPDDIGVPAYVNENIPNLLCGYHLTILRANKKCDGKYLMYALTTPKTKNDFYRFANGITRFGLMAESYKKILINLPPLAEQRAIAEALGQWDSAIEKTDALIAAKQKQFEWLLKTLISDQQSNPKWQSVTLGDVGDISSAGVDKKTVKGEQKVSLLNYLDIYRRDKIYAGELTHKVTAPAYKVTKCAVKKGDVFFTPSSEVSDDIASSAVAMEDVPGGVYSYHIVRLRPQIKIDLLYSAFAFKGYSFYKQASQYADGSGQRYVISQANFRKIKISLPAYAKQKRIGHTLNTALVEIQELRKLADHYRTQKRGIMQKLLTGQWRMK